MIPRRCRANRRQPLTRPPAPPRRAVATWPGLASHLAQHVGHELLERGTGRKAPDASLSATLRRLVGAAEDERRSGRRGLLARRAGRLFAHVRTVLEAVSLAATSPIGRDYSHVLRAHLLPSAEYCAAAAPADFQGLAELHMAALEEPRALDRADEAHRALGARLAAP